MSMINGVVEFFQDAAENRFGQYSIRVGGQYFNSKFPIKCKKGDVVEFDSGASGKYVGKLRVVEGGASPTPSPASSPSVQFPVGKNDKARSIVRQNSLTHATALYRTIIDSNKAKVSDASEAASKVISLARMFEAYSCGELDALELEEALNNLNADESNS